MGTLTLEDINHADREVFVEQLGEIYEHSPWVAERSYSARPFESVPTLRQTFKQTVTEASKAEQLELLQAHPQLGADAELTDASETEQQSAGLDSLSPAQYERLQELNQRYSERFGFPFIMAVKHQSVDAIQEAMETRLTNSAKAEFEAALTEVHTIAAIRLEELLST